MSKPINVHIVERARALIQDERHWCPGDLARDAFGHAVSPTDTNAEQRCALGALVAAAFEVTRDSRLAHHLAMTSMRPLVGASSLSRINDDEGHAAVIALFDLAIADMTGAGSRAGQRERPQGGLTAGRASAAPRNTFG